MLSPSSSSESLNEAVHDNNNIAPEDLHKICLPPNKLSRQYRCDKCAFITFRSRLFLFHQVLKHEDTTSVALCTHCEYASRWRCKVTRHHSMLHKEEPPLRDQDIIVKEAHQIREEYEKKGCSLERLLPEEKSTSFQDDQLLLDEKVSNYCSKTVGPFVKESDHAEVRTRHDTSNKTNTPEKRDKITKESSKECNQALINGGNNADATDKNEVSQSGHPSTDDMVCICPVCGYSAPSPRLQDEHMELAHGESSSLIIDQSEADIDSYGPPDGEQCDDRFSDVDGDRCGSPTSGKTAVDSRRRYRCNVCTATFPWHGNLAEHMREMHGLEKPRDWRGKAGNYRCTHCKYVAKYQSELRRHMRLHLGVKPFDCVFCKYRSAWKGDLKRHIESHHREKFDNDSELSMIMARYKNNAGTDLKLSQESSDILFDQDYDSSQDGTMKSEDASLMSSDRPFRDASVDLSYRSKSAAGNVGGLQTFNSGPPSPSASTNPSPALSTLPSAKEKSAVGRLPCPQCNYMAQNQSKLNNHMASHTNLRLFRCPVCGQRSNYKWDVRKHIKSQHPEQAHLDVIQMTTDEALGLSILDSREEGHPSHCEEKSIVSSDLVEATKRHKKKEKKEFSPIINKPKSNSDVTASSEKDGHKATDLTWNDLTSQSTPNFTMNNMNAIQNFMQATQSCSPMSSLASSQYMFGLQQNIYLTASMFPYLMGAGATTSSPDVSGNQCDFGQWQSRFPQVTGIPYSNEEEKTNQIPASKSANTTPLPCQALPSSTPVSVPLGHNSADPSVADTSDSEERLGLQTIGRTDLKKESGLLKGEQWKRFKCSGCGHRSNWKWDINKHIKVAHPERAGIRTIQLSADDAKATLPAYLASARVTKTRAQGLSDSEEGYYRPFKCSLCGHRSNWKWDVNKHLKQVHQGAGSVITLSMEEAKKTIAMYKDRRRLAQSNASSDISLDHTKPNTANGVDPPSSSIQSGMSAISPRVDILRLKRFQCSECGYRSNYRSDIARHNRRKHRGEGCVIVLTESDAKQSLDQYVRNFPQRSNALFRKSLIASGVPELANLNLREGIMGVKARKTEFQHLNDNKTKGMTQGLSTAVHSLPRKIWRCALCTFTSRDKVPIMRHITKIHKPARPFSCRVCEYSTDYRNSLIRHIRARHDDTNFASYINTNMRKIRETDVRKSETNINTPSEPEEPLKTMASETTTENPCPVCSLAFGSVQEVIFHCIDSHAKSDEDMYKIFRGIAKEPSDHNINKFPCHICSYVADQRDVLEVHKMQHTNECQYEHVCKFCSYRSSHTKFLKFHEDLHMQVKEDLPEDLSFSKERTIIKDEPHDLSVPKPSVKDADMTSTKRPRQDDDDNGKHEGLKPSSKRRRQEDTSYYSSHSPFVSTNLEHLSQHKQRHRVTPRACLKCNSCTFSTFKREALEEHSKTHQTQLLEETEEGLEDWKANDQNSRSSPSDSSDVKDVAFHLRRFREILEEQIQKDVNSNVAFDTELCEQIGLSCEKHYFYCDECPFFGESRDEFRTHLSRHGSRGSIVCSICDYSAPSAEELSKHRQFHKAFSKSHVLSLFSYDDVRKEWFSIKSLMSPSTNSETHICPLCPYIANCSEKLEVHLGYHGNNEFSLRCETCSFKHSRQEPFLRHLKLHNQ